MDPAAVLALYRIVQEAVTNAATHAKAREAAVTLRPEDGMNHRGDSGRRMRVRVSRVPERNRDDGHIGLVGMRERAEAVGGSPTVQTSPGKGTTVRASVPMVGPDGEQW